MLLHIGGFVMSEHMTGLEGGGDCGSNRFADELHENRKICRKLNSTVCCSPGRAAKGVSPVIRTTLNVS